MEGTIRHEKGGRVIECGDSNDGNCAVCMYRREWHIGKTERDEQYISYCIYPHVITDKDNADA